MLDATPAQADPGRVTEANPTRPDPEVPERAHRRTFTARYKLDVLAAYDAADPGEKGAILRREGLHSSHVVDWRRARDAGALAALAQPRASHYRRHRSSPAPQRPAPVAQPDRAQPRALSPVEGQAILDALHSDRFVDLAPTEVWACLLYTSDAADEEDSVDLGG